MACYPTEDALDAIKMCNAAKSCTGFHKVTILSEAIADLLWAFQPPSAELKSEELDKLYANYLANANLHLVLTKQEQMTMRTDATTKTITIKQLQEAFHDTVKIRAASKTCVGPRRLQIVAKAEAKYVSARDAYERLSGEKDMDSPYCVEECCCCFCF
jgi:hypothetical protein